MKSLKEILNENENQEECSELFGSLFQSRDVAHIHHLNTNSYAEHMALNDYYNGIIPLVDSLIETYQGYYGICTFSIPASSAVDNVAEYLKSLNESVIQARGMFDKNDLQNTIDSITELISSTVYKLTTFTK